MSDKKKGPVILGPISQDQIDSSKVQKKEFETTQTSSQNQGLDFSNTQSSGIQTQRPRTPPSQPSQPQQAVPPTQTPPQPQKLSSPSSGPPTRTGTQHLFDFKATMSEFAAIFFKNLILTLLTLGIYTPWAKTERRKFLWASTEFHGNRFEWLGTGKELFKGYLKIISFIAIYTIGLTFLQSKMPEIAVIAQIIFSLMFGFFVPYAIFSAYRYRLSRTAWRGVRFGVDPVAKTYVSTFLGGYILSFLTLGIYTPFWQNNLYSTTINNSRFGTAYFAYDGLGKEVFAIWLKGVILSILTLGIYLPWMWAEISKYRWSHTYLGEAQGRLHLTGSDLLGHILINLVIIVLTLGLAAPFILVRNARFLLSRVEFVGNIDFNAIMIRDSYGNPNADSMADVMDVGLEI